MDVHPTKNVSIGIDPYPILWICKAKASKASKAPLMCSWWSSMNCRMLSSPQQLTLWDSHISIGFANVCKQQVASDDSSTQSKSLSQLPGLLLIKHDENTHACARFWDPGWSGTCYNSTMAGSAQATECYRCHSLCLGPECHWASGPRSSHLALPLIWLGMQLNAIECNSCRCHVKDQKSLSIEGRKQDCKGETEELWNYKRCQHLWTHPSWAWVRTKGSSMSLATWVISTRLKGSNILPLHVSQSCFHYNILHA